ncbi:MAG: Uma2 family endonuclease [Cyanobacteria bacterium P01_F01_bin.42]
MAVATYKWSIERYHEAVEAGVFRDQAVELLRGDLVAMSPEGIPHAGLSSDCADELRRLLGDRVKVREGKPITLPNASEPEPDIAIVQPLGEVYHKKHHPYPKDVFWVIEYSNTSLEKDLTVKSQVYAEVGIEEYWVVNLKARELVLFRCPVDGEYQTRQTLDDGAVSPQAFPGVEVRVSVLIG